MWCTPYTHNFAHIFKNAVKENNIADYARNQHNDNRVNNFPASFSCFINSTNTLAHKVHQETDAQEKQSGKSKKPPIIAIESIGEGCCKTNGAQTYQHKNKRT